MPTYFVLSILPMCDKNMAHKTYGEQIGNILDSNLLWIIHFDTEVRSHDCFWFSLENEKNNYV